MLIDSINKFVHSFIINSKDSNNIKLLEKWNSEANQKLFMKIIKKNSNKDPNKPKRGKSGYLFFCKFYREKLKQENPNLSVKQIVSLLGNIWNNMKTNNPDEVEKYEKLSLEDRERYKNEMKHYELENKTKLKEKKKLSKKNVGFERFARSKSRKTKLTHPELDSENVITYLYNKWENFPDSKKQKYIKNKKKINSTVSENIIF